MTCHHPPLAPRQRPLFFRGNSRSESAPISENSWRFGDVLTSSGPRELGQPLGGVGCPVLPAGRTEPPQIASESRILATFCASLSAGKRRWPIDPFARRGDRSRPQGTNCNVSCEGRTPVSPVHWRRPRHAAAPPGRWLGSWPGPEHRHGRTGCQRNRTGRESVT